MLICGFIIPKFVKILPLQDKISWFLLRKLYFGFIDIGDSLAGLQQRRLN